MDQLTDQVTEEFAEIIRKHVLTLEATEAQDAAVEKALHKAAIGDLQAAGKIIREHLISGAIAIKFIPIGMAKSKQAAEFRDAGSAINKAIGAANRRKVTEARIEILESRNTPPTERELAGLIAKKTDIPLNTVRGHLQKMKKDKSLD